MSRRSTNIFLLAIAVLLLACNRVPDYVIPPDEMSQVLADIHVGESYVELNYSDFADDSSRMALKQSVLAKYGYTLADLDTSFMWYGAHLKEYDKVYDGTVKILEERLAGAGAVGSGSSTVHVAGDSVDVWSGPQGFALTSRSPSSLTTFVLESDNNWKIGDQYTWRAKFLNNKLPGAWTIVAEYSDGTTEYLTTNFGGDGWKEVTFFADSTKTARRLYGVLNVDASAGTPVFLDSMQLVRNRLDKRLYPQRYRQRNYSLTKD